MNDPLFSREALNEYTKRPERSTHVKTRKLKNCYTKTDQKTVETVTNLLEKVKEDNEDPYLAVLKSNKHTTS